jgi:malonyl-CoA O-methyltransferase
MIDKEKLKRRFSRNIETYDEYANVQKHMSKKLLSMVQIEDGMNILEIGCGTGYLTKLILEKDKNVKITAVDIAPGMIEFCKKDKDLKSVDFFQGDIEKMDLTEEYDLIISNATFQWFNHLDETLKKLKESLSKYGVLLFSTFGQDTFCELRESYKKVSEKLEKEVSSPSPKFINKEVLDQILGKDNYTYQEENFKEYFNNSVEFMKSVKKVGANNSSSTEARADRKFLSKVIEYYDETYLEEDGVYATYNNLYIRV